MAKGIWSKLFGKAPAPPAVTFAPLPKDLGPAFANIDLAGLTIQPSDEALLGGLESWGWIGLEGLRPLLVTATGDVFFEASDAIVFLDTIEGDLLVAAADMTGLATVLSEPDGRDRWLLEGLLRAVQARGAGLADGQCYDFAVAPVLGGPIEADALAPFNFEVKLNIAGQLHEQVRNLPPGTKIGKVTISD